MVGKSDWEGLIQVCPLFQDRRSILQGLLWFCETVLSHLGTFLSIKLWMPWGKALLSIWPPLQKFWLRIGAYMNKWVSKWMSKMLLNSILERFQRVKMYVTIHNSETNVGYCVNCQLTQEQRTRNDDPPLRSSNLHAEIHWSWMETERDANFVWAFEVSQLWHTSDLPQLP